MQSAVAADAARDNLATISNELFEGLRVFVINIGLFIGTVFTDSFACPTTTKPVDKTVTTSATRTYDWTLKWIFSLARFCCNINRYIIFIM